MLHGATILLCRPGSTFPMGGAASSKDQTWMVGTCGSFLYAWRAKDLWTWRRYPASTSSSSVTSSWLSYIEQEEIRPNTLPFLTEKVAETLVHFPIGMQHNSWLARMQVICPLTMIWSKNTLDWLCNPCQVSPRTASAVLLCFNMFHISRFAFCQRQFGLSVFSWSVSNSASLASFQKRCMTSRLHFDTFKYIWHKSNKWAKNSKDGTLVAAWGCTSVSTTVLLCLNALQNPSQRYWESGGVIDDRRW